MIKSKEKQLKFKEKIEKTNKKKINKNELKNLKNLVPYPDSGKFSAQLPSVHCNGFSSTQSEIDQRKVEKLSELIQRKIGKG